MNPLQKKRPMRPATERTAPTRTNKPRNYYSLLVKTQYHIYAWPNGWEVRLRWDEWSKSQTIDMPSGMSKESRADAKRTIAMYKRVAQAVQTKDEYDALWKRIDKEDWDYIITNDLKGSALVSWANNTRTADEYYKLLRYN